MEPLRQAFRNDVAIQGIQIGSKHFKCSAFADDLLLYVTNPDISLPVMMVVLEEFGLFSSYKINWSKR